MHPKLRIAVAAIVVALVLVQVPMTPRLWRLVYVLPLWLAMLNLLQAREKT